MKRIIYRLDLQDLIDNERRYLYGRMDGSTCMTSDDVYAHMRDLLWEEAKKHIQLLDLDELVPE